MPAAWDGWRRYVGTYGLTADRTVPVSLRACRIDTQGGSYEARLATEAAANLRMWVTDYAAHRRFRNTQRFLRNLYFDRTVPVAPGTVFYLTDAWHAPSLQTTPSDVEAAVDNLVQLHGALHRVGNDTPLVAPEGAARYGTWTRALSTGADAFAAERVVGAARMAAQGPVADDDTGAWRDWLSRWEQLARSSVASLERAGYRDLAAEAAGRKDIAWNGYGLRSLQRLANGRIMTTQPADPQWDDALYDLATLCREICAAGHAAGVVEAIGRYAALLPLTAEQRHMVRAFAAFPHESAAWVRFHRGMPAAVPDWRERAARQFRAATALLDADVDA